MEQKRLYRSREHVLVAGVLAGVAEYFAHDPTLWRLGFIIFLIATGLMPGILIYLAAWILVPQAPSFEYRVVDDTHETNER